MRPRCHGRLLRQVVDEQVPVALAAEPDLVSPVAGGNDLMRPGADPDELAATLEDAVVRLRAAGADVLLAIAVDTRQTPILRRVRGKIAIFNAHVWSIAARSGAVVQDWRLWDVDRIHLTDEAHRRMALAAAAALGLHGADDDWRTPLPPADPRPLRVAVAEEAAWVRGSWRRGSVGACAAARPVTGARRSGPSLWCCPARRTGRAPTPRVRRRGRRTTRRSRHCGRTRRSGGRCRHRGR